MHHVVCRIYPCVFVVAVVVVVVVAVVVVDDDDDDVVKLLSTSDVFPGWSFRSTLF